MANLTQNAPNRCLSPFPTLSDVRVLPTLWSRTNVYGEKLPNDVPDVGDKKPINTTRPKSGFKDTEFGKQGIKKTLGSIFGGGKKKR